MKEKIFMFIIGLLVGAILATGGFYIYQKNNNNEESTNTTTENKIEQFDDRGGRGKMPGSFEDGEMLDFDREMPEDFDGEMPEREDGEEPPELPDGVDEDSVSNTRMQKPSGNRKGSGNNTTTEDV